MAFHKNVLQTMDHVETILNFVAATFFIATKLQQNQSDLILLQCCGTNFLCVKRQNSF